MDCDHWFVTGRNGNRDTSVSSHSDGVANTSARCRAALDDVAVVTCRHVCLECSRPFTFIRNRNESLSTSRPRSFVTLSNRIETIDARNCDVIGHFGEVFTELTQLSKVMPLVALAKPAIPAMAVHRCSQIQPFVHCPSAPITTSAVLHVIKTKHDVMHNNLSY